MRSLFLFLLTPQVSHELRKYVPDLGHSSFDSARVAKREMTGLTHI